MAKKKLEGKKIIHFVVVKDLYYFKGRNSISRYAGTMVMSSIDLSTEDCSPYPQEDRERQREGSREKTRQKTERRSELLHVNVSHDE